MPVVPRKSFEETYDTDRVAKEQLQSRQNELLQRRYDLRDQPSDVIMSGGRTAVQRGVRVLLFDGMNWEQLAAMTPASGNGERSGAPSFKGWGSVGRPQPPSDQVVTKH